MLSLRRNRSLLIKILLFTPLTWLCVVLYMNSSTKELQQQQPSNEEQIVYVENNKLNPEKEQIIQQEHKVPAEVKGPPLKDNQLRKKKPTPPPGFLSYILYFSMLFFYLSFSYYFAGGEVGLPGGGGGQGVLLPPREPDGPGEMGKPVVLPKDPTPEIKKIIDEGWQKNAFNQYISDMISIHRTLPDPRDEK